MKFVFGKLHVLLLFSALLMANVSFAQEMTITGKVTDASTKEPLVGVTVVIQGTTSGTTTDFDGNYRLNVAKGQNLVFSFIGYKSQTITISDQTTLNVALAVETKGLDEVVVIGYGQVKKSDATGSVVAVDSKDFNKGAITSPQDLLVGKSAGVVITPGSGAPGSGATIRIRGGSSLNASNDPLIIVDGVPLDNNTISGSSNFLSFMNPNDIETFTVLKDASATAIYGSRASNGVILITTKKGKAGAPMKISYDGNTSVATPEKYVDVYSGDEMRQIAAANMDLFGAETLSKLGQENTNWQKEIFRTTISQEHNLSLSGAVKWMPYRVSVGYTDQNGILKNTGLKRMTASINLNPTLLNGDLKFNISAKGMNTDNNFGDTNAIGSAINMDPTQPVKDGNPKSDGYFQWEHYGANLGTANPVEQALAVDNKANVKRFVGNAQVDYKLPFLPDMHAHLNVATDYTKSEGHNNRPTTAPSVLTSPTWGRLTNYNGKNYNNLLDFYLNYAKNIESINSKVDVTGGYSWQHFKRENFNYARGIVDDLHPYQKTDSTTTATENYLVSFFGRVNYTLADKYLLTFTIRDDGSSRFASGNQWGIFPSAAFAWKMKEESFLKNVKAISEMKLRLGWGITGQQDIGSDYPAQAKYVLSNEGYYYPIGGEFLPTLRPDAYDPNIKWEQTTTQNIGLDFGFLNNRIYGSIDVYKRVTDNLLNQVTIPSGSNFSNTLLTNVGSLENKGAEFSLNMVPISKKDMSLNIGFNVTYNKNKITKLLLTDDPTYIGILYGSGMTGQNQVTRVGYPAYSFFVNQQVYDSNGKPIEGLYVDRSGDGGTVSGDNNDKYIYHNPVPDYTMGLSLRFNYKNFDLSASSRASIGNYVYNQNAAGSSLDQMQQIGYWKNFPRVLNETNFVKRQFSSDYFVQNASFFKLDNLSAGYQLDHIFDKLSARVSFTVQNVFTITNYNGLDPEVTYSEVGGVKNVPGIDTNFYPRARTFVLGVNLTY
ncbi:SusC/RagA family TonB-linked outer membrane protein [Prolixibacter bellariivorans]|uniref:SusC/RagA family TonB-linked outer membrane protein n=1 Tax=Prolixibacter bellariivorans TaxID=314319 RepID=A0A5M4AZI6_9BACT|nr:TonB-dependent receptor [Prolixibacter bellariivorans]GET32827.1 SusC/RagA family TonB-linked outer membrane protein [Prolixibacter bellariivorans]